MPEEKTKDTKTAEATTEAPVNQDISLTVADLRNLRTIIDVASSRGAFRGAELKSVGEAFEKLDSFVKAVDAKAQAENPTSAEGESKKAPAEEKSKE